MTPEIAKLLVLVLVFGAVLLGVETIGRFAQVTIGGSRAINRRLRLIAAGTDRETVLARLRRDDGGAGGTGVSLIARLMQRLSRMIHVAGVSWSSEMVARIIVIAPMLILALVVGIAMATGYPLTAGLLLLCLAFAVALGGGIPLIVLSRLAQRRRKRMQGQFPVALDTFVRSLRAGHPVAAAIELLTQEMEDPIGSEFGIVSDEVTYGAELREALQRMANRWEMNEIHMFVISLSVQAETGGNLAEILENLSGVVRERASLMLKVRALSSEGRMTAMILTALPIMAFSGLFLFNPAFYLDVADDRGFVIGFSALIALYVVGFVSIRRMVDLKV